MRRPSHAPLRRSLYWTALLLTAGLAACSDSEGTPGGGSANNAADVGGEANNAPQDTGAGDEGPSLAAGIRLQGVDVMPGCFLHDYKTAGDDGTGQIPDEICVPGRFQFMGDFGRGNAASGCVVTESGPGVFPLRRALPIKSAVRRSHES